MLQNGLRCTINVKLHRLQDQVVILAPHCIKKLFHKTVARNCFNNVAQQITTTTAHCKNAANFNPLLRLKHTIQDADFSMIQSVLKLILMICVLLQALFVPGMGLKPAFLRPEPRTFMQ